MEWEITSMDKKIESFWRNRCNKKDRNTEKVEQ